MQAESLTCKPAAESNAKQQAPHSDCEAHSSEEASTGLTMPWC